MALRPELAEYVVKIEATLVSRSDKHISRDRELIPKEVGVLSGLVEDLECTAEFQSLVRETARSFSGKPNKTSFLDLWSENVKAFFRRSGFYLSTYRQRLIDLDDLVANYTNAFSNKKTIVRYLVPLEFVQFDQNEFEFDSFRVCRLDRDELRSSLRNETNRVFYPYAYGDTAILGEIWFLEVSETVEAWEPGSGGPAGLRGAELAVKATDFHSTVEYALKHLALFDWGTYQAPFGVTQPSKLIPKLDTGWDRFHVPFIITIHENELWAPNALPDLTKLSTEPDHNWEGEEIGEKAVVSIFVEGDQFKPTIERIVDLMTTSESERSNEWLFLDTALSYIAKAFFADGLDQLLWHFVAIESLLGDRDSSLTKRLAKRVAFVVADDNQSRSRIRRLITSPEGLYQLRSDLVHGNSELVQKKVYLGHLREARELARKSVLWFLETLSNIHLKQALALGSKIPTREEVVAAIDVFSDDKIEASSVQGVMGLFFKRSAAQAKKE